MMNDDQGFSLDYVVAGAVVTPLPPRCVGSARVEKEEEASCIAG